MVTLLIESNHAGQRLDKFLGKYLSGASAGFCYKMLRKKNITLNDKRAEGRELLQPGDRVTLWLADETILKFGGYLPDREGKESLPLETEQNGNKLYRKAYEQLQGISVVYEDDHVLILDKPAGVLTQQARAGDMSLNEWMIGYLLETNALDDSELRLFKPSVCNRLDRNTGGLVLCGKSLPGSQALSELIRSRAVRKFYRALCAGTFISGNPVEIQGFLQKNPRTNRVTVSSQGPGDCIRTVYRPLAQYRVSCVPGDGKDLLFSELEVELITGKTHQIRAHLAAEGHPLVGDGKYGDARINQLFRQRFHLQRQLLQACRLEFPALEGTLAPLGGRSIQVPLPADYESVLTGLECV